MSEEEQEGEAVQRGRPNAYFAAQREAERTGMGSGFRGVPGPGRPKAEALLETVGDYDTCWCGEPADHDWPGKAEGRRHPRKEGKVSAVAEEAPHITRRDLRAYHEDLTTGILHCVNGYGLRYRELRNSILIYPKDGTEPFQIYARNNTHQVKRFQAWFVKHVAIEGMSPALIKDRERVVDDFDAKMKTAAQIDVEDVLELAEVLNGPEHPVPTPADVAKRVDVSRETLVQSTESEWVPHVTKEGRTTIYETDGQSYRCTICGQVFPDMRSGGGHTNTHQKEKMRAALYDNDDAKAKKADSQKHTALKNKVEAVIEVLADAIGMDVSGGAEALQAKLLKVEAELAEVRTERDDLKAKLDLIREGLKL